MSEEIDYGKLAKFMLNEYTRWGKECGYKF